MIWKDRARRAEKRLEEVERRVQELELTLRKALGPVEAETPNAGPGEASREKQWGCLLDYNGIREGGQEWKNK